MKSRSPDPRGGFSLVEVLLASVLIAAAGGMLMAGLASASRGASMRADQALMAQLLASQLALLDDPLPADVPEPAALSGALSAYQMSAQVEAMPQTPLQRATLSVAHGVHRAALVTWRRPRPDAQP